LRSPVPKLELRKRRTTQTLPGLSNSALLAGDPLDDVVDDARYGIYTFITSTEKPREVVLRETLAPIIETAQDSSLSEAERKAAATSVLLRRQQIMAEYNHGRQPATLGRGRKWLW
jgi:hypothetical protein